MKYIYAIILPLSFGYLVASEITITDLSETLVEVASDTCNICNKKATDGVILIGSGIFMSSHENCHKTIQPFVGSIEDIFSSLPPQSQISWQKKLFETIKKEASDRFKTASLLEIYHQQGKNHVDLLLCTAIGTFILREIDLYRKQLSTNYQNTHFYETKKRQALREEIATYVPFIKAMNSWVRTTQKKLLNSIHLSKESK